MNFSLTLHGTLRHLPLVLCGPMLRKVTPDSVTVWLALHSACKVKLIIFDAFESDYTDTIKIGLHLHLACVTAKAKVPAEKLVWNKLYYYNVKFCIGGISPDCSDGTVSSLEEPQICRDVLQSFKDDFCYGEEYPSFIMPPDAANLEHLRFMHGSCRKPHGLGLDALSCVDTLIDNNLKYPLNRPQLLCLTGDQIYADEVDDSLISIIGEVADKMLTGITHTEYGDRSELMKNIGFTSNECHNQLIAFSEFVAMYLLVWSEELWPMDISNANAELQEFRKKLPAVRRALANIPSYMVFDDHEITDDWNRLKSWRENTYLPGFENYSNPEDMRWASHAIIANGLLAYALFQGWGNLGDIASTLPTYSKIFNILKRPEPPCTDPMNLYDLQSLMLPITATEDNWTYLKYPDNETPWSFRVAYSGFQIIGLDSRNLRGYRTGIHAPAVIYPGNIPSQLGTDYSKPLTIVMCGAPLFGIEAIEYFQSQTDMEVPILLSNLKIKFRYDNKYDKEAWSFDSEAFHTMQVELAKFEKIVVLSGDVHYGFSAKVDYWNEQTATPQTAVFAQCCSSALHNKNTEGASAGMKMGRLLSKGNESVWTKKTGLTTNYSLVDKTTYEDKPQSYSVYQQIRIKLFLDLTIKPVTPTNLTTFISEGILQEQNRKIINSALIADTNIGLIFFSGNNLHHRLITPMPNEKLPKNQIVATHIIDFQLPNVLDKPVKP